jgi:hypothetical protein
MAEQPLGKTPTVEPIAGACTTTVVFELWDVAAATAAVVVTATAAPAAKAPKFGSQIRFIGTLFGLAA